MHCAKDGPMQGWSAVSAAECKVRVAVRVYVPWRIAQLHSTYFRGSTISQRICVTSADVALAWLEEGHEVYSLKGQRTTHLLCFPLGERFLVPGVIQPSWHKQRLSHEEAFIWLSLVTDHWKGKEKLSKNNSLAVSVVVTGRKFLRNRETHAPMLCALAVLLPPLQSGVLNAHWMWKTLGLKKWLPSSTLHVSVTVRVQSILSEGKYQVDQGF